MQALALRPIRSAFCTASWCGLVKRSSIRTAWIALALDQCAALRNPPGQIEPQQANAGGALVREPNNPSSLKTEVVAPTVPSRMEQGSDPPLFEPDDAMSEPFQALQRIQENARLSGEESVRCFRLMMWSFGGVYKNLPRGAGSRGGNLVPHAAVRIEAGAAPSP